MSYTKNNFMKIKNLGIVKIGNKANMFSDCFIIGNLKFKFKT